MKFNNLSFSHAYKGRIKPDKKTISKATEEVFIDRLAGELEKGNLPFVDYSFGQDLLQELGEVMGKMPKVNNMLLLGIGGSALGARALQKAFAPEQDLPGYKGPWLWIADNIDAISLNSYLKNLDPVDTVVTVISKSGGTIETISQFLLLKDWLKDALGDNWGRHVIAITDPSAGPLRQEAENKGFLSLPVPSKMGGRYSIFSAVGLLPAAFMGMDYTALLKGATDLASSLVDKPDSLVEHPSYKLALWAYELMESGYDELIFFTYIPLWSYVGAWFEQLWAESLGKDGKGSLPIPALGVTDQHSLQQMFLGGSKNKACLFMSAENMPEGPFFPEDISDKWSFLKAKNFGDILKAEATGTRMAMVETEIPLVHVKLSKPDEEACGRLMSLLMLTTLFTGWIMDINPLDQPAVELGKRLANAELGASGYEKEAKALASFLADEGKDEGLNF